MAGPNGSAIYALWVFMPFGDNRVMKIRLQQKNLLLRDFQIKEGGKGPWNAFAFNTPHRDTIERTVHKSVV